MFHVEIIFGISVPSSSKSPSKVWNISCILVPISRWFMVVYCSKKCYVLLDLIQCSARRIILDYLELNLNIGYFYSRETSAQIVVTWWIEGYTQIISQIYDGIKPSWKKRNWSCYWSEPGIVQPKLEERERLRAKSTKEIKEERKF